MWRTTNDLVNTLYRYVIVVVDSTCELGSPTYIYTYHSTTFISKNYLVIKNNPINYFYTFVAIEDFRVLYCILFSRGRFLPSFYVLPYLGVKPVRLAYGGAYRSDARRSVTSQRIKSRSVVHKTSGDQENNNIKPTSIRVLKFDNGETQMKGQ